MKKVATPAVRELLKALPRAEAHDTGKLLFYAIERAATPWDLVQISSHKELLCHWRILPEFTRRVREMALRFNGYQEFLLRQRLGFNVVADVRRTTRASKAVDIGLSKAA